MAKKYKCPVPGCGRDAKYIRFSAHEVIVRSGETLPKLLATATHSSNAKAPEARNILVRCEVHGEKNVQVIGHHITGSKKRQPRSRTNRPLGTSGVPDVLADNPVGTMERFNDGLRRVLAVQRGAILDRKPHGAHAGRTSRRRPKPSLKGHQ